MKLRDYAKHATVHQVGCLSNLCIWGAPDGMTTNGPCHCERDDARRQLRIMARVLAAALAEVEEK